MRRAPILIASTAVGMGLVLSFHTAATKTTKLKITSQGSSSPSSSTPPTTAGTGSAGAGGPTTTAPGASTRSVDSQDIQYQYGDIELKVTENGSRITDISIVSNGAIDGRSQQINSIAVPQLVSQALQSQSDQIDGVSGATFTSQAFAYALQNALQQLGK